MSHPIPLELDSVASSYRGVANTVLSIMVTDDLGC